VQVIIKVEVEAATYVSEEYQSRIRAPEVCPNCGTAGSLEAHGYYWRWVTEAFFGKLLLMAVRRFFACAAQ
jgi:ribosomal protein S27AE